MRLQRPTGPTFGHVRSWLRCVLAVALALAILAGSPCARAQSEDLLGHPAPDFALHAAGGGNVRLSEHRGEVVVVSFWSRFCWTCRAQLVQLDKSLETYRSAGLKVYGISVDGGHRAAEKATERHLVTFQLLVDPDESVSRLYRVKGLPTTVLIDRNGIVRYVLREHSKKSEDLYLTQLRALLNE